MIGFKIMASENALVARWVFPTYRFFEWEPKDEKLCRLIGEGHEVMEPGAYRIGNTMLMHPTIFRELKRLERDL